MAPLVALINELPRDLRERAFIHYTWVEEAADSYKRLAFIGDSVLGLSVAADLHARFPDSHPGKLTMIRSRAVCGVACEEVGRELGVREVLGAMEKPSHKLAMPTEALLEATRPVAEITEALIGGCFLTFGFEPTRAAVVAAFEPQILAGEESPLDPKSLLHQLFKKTQVTYEVLSKTGSDHSPVFEVAAIVDFERVGEGEGRTKKEAEHAAAEDALESLDTEAVRRALALGDQLASKPS